MDEALLAQAPELEAPAEEALPEEKETFTLPDDASVDFEIYFDEEEPTVGSVAHFRAVLTGYNEVIYNLQWQRSLDREAWEDVPGEIGETMDVELTEQTCQYYWRLKTIVRVSDNI